MLSVYIPRGSALERVPIKPDEPLPDSAVWIDLVSPTALEDKPVEQMLGVAVPTREEMQEIEVSSRLYVENDARYMTATLMSQSDTATPKTTAVTFIHSISTSKTSTISMARRSLCGKRGRPSAAARESGPVSGVEILNKK